MAVDEVLLENADQGQLCLRFYAWLPDDAFAWGTFSSVAERDEHVGQPLVVRCVRRASGGGAIVHDDDRHELTYSVAVPGLVRARQTQRELYDATSSSLNRRIGFLGVHAQSCPTAGARSPTRSLSVFSTTHRGGCVDRSSTRSPGSAQRRLPNAVLQHGSVLLSQSTGAPELPGIAQMSGVSLAADELRVVWLERLTQSWPVHWQVSELSHAERRRADAKVATKFGHDSWTRRR